MIRDPTTSTAEWRKPVETLVRLASDGPSCLLGLDAPARSYVERREITEDDPIEILLATSEGPLLLAQMEALLGGQATVGRGDAKGSV